MRNTFAKHITELAKKDPRIILMMGDIGNRMFDEFKSIATDKFINCGIAEANMMSMAAGLALSGMRPFVYTITPFVTLRCLEQIRISVAYHNAKVILVGTGSGLSYAELGPTHHSLDDIGILKMIPNLNLYTPCDPQEVKYCMNDALNSESACYIRLGKKGEPNLDSAKLKENFKYSRFLRTGNESIILGYGPILSEAIDASEKIKNENNRIAVASMRRIVPLDSIFLKYLVKNNFKNWYILEEHYKNGGLYSILLNWLYENKLLNQINIKSISIPNEFVHELGKQEFVRNNYGLKSKSIAKIINKK